MHSPRLILAVAATTAVAVAAPAVAAAAPITMSGSTSVAPLAAALAKKYVKVKPGTKFSLLQGSTDVGINDVAHGRVTIGNASRDPLPSDPGGLYFNKIARDGICIITNPSNSLATLSQKQVQDIFTGRIRSWSQVPGAKASGAIDLVTRVASSGTADAFTNIFLGPSLKIAANAAAKGSNGLVQQTIHSDKNAIGFVSFDFTSGTAPVPYGGVACNLRNAKSGSYTGVRNFWMVTRGKPAGAVAAWIKWIQNDAAAASIIGTNWLPRK